MNVTFELSAKIFKEIIEGATATLDKKHVQVYPKVVLLEILENKVRFITCNSEIILEQEVNTTINNFSEDFSLNLHFFIQSLESKMFSLIQIPITKESKGNILFSVSEKACQIIYQAKKYDIFISNEPYPDYKSVIPTKNPYFFTISTENLQKAMNRAVLLYPNLAYKDIVMTRFFIEGKKMFVTTINQDKDGQMEEIFDVEVENPPANKFGFAMYSPYMQLASTLLADCEEIKITYLSPKKVFLTSCDQAELKRKLALFPKQGTNYPEQDGENGVKYKNVLLNVGETKNITISSKTLYDALTIVKDFAKETKVNDFLLKDKFYFKVTEGQIEIIVQILDDNLVKVTFPFENYKDVQEFCGLLNFSAFYKFLKPDSLSVQPISLKFNENSNIFEVVHEDGTALFTGQTCQIFPKFNYPQEKTSLGVIDAAKFSKKLSNLFTVNNHSKKVKHYKKFIGKTQPKMYYINVGAVDLLPKKNDFELFYGRVKTENYFNGIFCLNLVEKIYKTEMFFSGDDVRFSQQDIDNVIENVEKLKLPPEKYEKEILFLEDVLLKKEQILPTPKEKKEKEAPKTTTKTTPSSYFLDANLPSFQGNITSYSLRNENTLKYERNTLLKKYDVKKAANLHSIEGGIWRETVEKLTEVLFFPVQTTQQERTFGKRTTYNWQKGITTPDFQTTIGYWEKQAEPSIFFDIKNANSGDKWEKICALTHFAEEFRQDAFIVKHKIPKEVAETLLDDEENYLKEFENGFILMPEVTFVFENMTKEDVFTIEKEILQVFGDFTIFTEVKEKDGTTLFSVSFFHQTTKTNENDKRKEISQAYGEFDENIKRLEGKFGEKSTKNIQGIYRNSDTSLDLSRLFCADNMGDTSNDLRPYTSVREEINVMLRKYGRKPCTYASDSKNTGLSAVAVEQKEAPKENQMWLSLKKQLIKEAAKGYDHFNLWYAETFLLKKGNRDTHNEILANLSLKPNAEIDEIFAKVKTTPTQEKSTENDPQTIAELVAWVKDNPKSNELKSVVYGEVTDEQAQKIEKATNIDISGFERVLDSYGIKHILKNHGGASEELRGQEPITLEDFKKIPDVVENYDKVFRTGINKRELETIAYLKRTNGVFFLLEEIREKKKKNIKQTVTQTLYKFKVGNNKTPDELMLSIQKAYTQDTSPTLTSNTSPGDAKVTEKPESTKEMLKFSMTKRIDVLKDLLQFADKIGKSALLDRIKVMKDLIKYTK